ncbi:T9SS C-terminal target domain-containing protein [Flavobacterium arcticum]|uniref:T9SS C-terminal target domain-containing protein n=1 Tax=Flavobacterium arcticum TaxID=1784713 RepID=A0A345HBT2_9FLAO|nr:T9SS type A sorting domain-containing protein [Flavobacterium arcticum]AXG74042.1 T9SS C-terminal target domain-containing protein [Flavobacterium arcticum]KAF2509017.1 T9SS type A sorting domain-containing protein [Flavobacterium arcticum]
MKKIYYIILLCFAFNFAQAQVTQVYTDYNNFWTSSSSSINSTQPNLSHNLLAFTWSGVTYSTGVDDAKLTSNGVTFQSTKFRALPITTVPLTSPQNAYFVGLGALTDGVANGVTSTAINPLVTTGALKASYLTTGENGLDLGTCLTNIPTGNDLTFNLSINGITIDNVNDGIPDILVSQIAQPTGTGVDKLYFADINGNLVGNSISINLSNNSLFPTVANWNVDFYNNDSTQSENNYINTNRTVKFFTADISQFGITEANYTSVRKLIYQPGGSSDPAFIAYNEPSIGVAQQIIVKTQPTGSDCDGIMPSDFTVQLADSFGDNVEQAGYEITAYMETGPGELLGTVTQATDATGLATFNDLSFEIGGDHTIRFENTSLKAGITENIIGDTNCSSNEWTGNNGTAWNDTANWTIADIPNANNDVTIPTGRPNYPVLTANAGANNLSMGAGATINLNGKLFAIKGNITKDETAYIDASHEDSELYMSGTTTQTIPDGFILDGEIGNFTVENAAGVSTLNPMYLSGILNIESGNFETNDIVTLVCSFSPNKTGQIDKIESGSSISGLITTEQCFPARRAYRLVTPTVTTTSSIRENWQENASAYNDNPNPGYGIHITGYGSSGSDPESADGTNGFDWQPSGASSIFTFNNSTQSWEAVSNTTDVLTAGTPYRVLIRGSRSADITSNATPPSNTKLRATGTITSGTTAINGLSSTEGDYNFVANPYHTIVDMNKVMGNASNLTNFYYVWDPTLGGTPVVGVSGGRGAYVTINASTGEKSNSSSAATRYAQPYQAFFVQTSSQGTTPILTFKEAYKRTTAAQTAVFRTSGTPYIALDLFAETEFINEHTSADGLRIDFREGYNNDVDFNDAKKFGNLDENISRLNGEEYIAMENRNLPAIDEELPLAVSRYRTSNYVMKLELGFFEELDVYIKDYYLNEETLLEQGNTTNFEFSVNEDIEASTDAARFAIVFRAAALSTENPITKNNFSLFPNPLSGSELYINAPEAYQTADVAIYNTIGQKVFNTSQPFNGSSQVMLQVGDLETGIYILKLKTETGATYSTRFIKR